MKPYDVNLIADYIILRFNEDRETGNLINLKLQKLLYYLQAWSLGINHRPFLNCEFEAWVHGPVCRVLYDRFKGLYTFVSCEPRDLTSQIDEDDRNFIDYILENYGGFSGSELETMTHQETPWIEARKGLTTYQASNKPISQECMMNYYGKKWQQLSKATTDR
jgi:uncharacterized phage-associated protein